MNDNNLIDVIGQVEEVDSVLPSPVLYQYYKQLNNRVIILDDEVDRDTLEKITIPYMEMCKEDPDAPVEIILNTVGGDLYNGMNFVDIIEKTETPTTIHIMGLALSMGLYIAMAGKHNPKVRTVCHKFSVGLLHSGYMFMEGSSHAVRDTFNFTQHYEEKVKEYVLSHSNLTEETYRKCENIEYWMDADEMLKLGIVDEII